MVCVTQLLYRFTLNLENLENIFMKSQGKPVVVREFFLICIQVRKNKLFNLHIAFINSCMIVCKVVVLFVSVNVSFITKHSAQASVGRLHIY